MLTGVDIDATPTYPAAYRNRNIMSVIATDQNDGLANYSNFGKNNADLAAPGSKILSTILNGQVHSQSLRTLALLLLDCMHCSLDDLCMYEMPVMPAIL